MRNERFGAITINCFLLKLLFHVDGVSQNGINCFQGNNSGSGAILMEYYRQGGQRRFENECFFLYFMRSWIESDLDKIKGLLLKIRITKWCIAIDPSGNWLSCRHECSLIKLNKYFEILNEFSFLILSQWSKGRLFFTHFFLSKNRIVRNKSYDLVTLRWT